MSDMSRLRKPERRPAAVRPRDELNESLTNRINRSLKEIEERAKEIVSKKNLELERKDRA